MRISYSFFGVAASLIAIGLNGCGGCPGKPPPPVTCVIPLGASANQHGELNQGTPVHSSSTGSHSGRASPMPAPPPVKIVRDPPSSHSSAPQSGRSGDSIHDSSVHGEDVPAAASVENGPRVEFVGEEGDFKLSHVECPEGFSTRAHLPTDLSLTGLKCEDLQKCSGIDGGLIGHFCVEDHASSGQSGSTASSDAAPPPQQPQQQQAPPPVLRSSPPRGSSGADVTVQSTEDTGNSSPSAQGSVETGVNPDVAFYTDIQKHCKPTPPVIDGEDAELEPADRRPAPVDKTREMEEIVRRAYHALSPGSYAPPMQPVSLSDTQADDLAEALKGNGAPPPPPPPRKQDAAVGTDASPHSPAQPPPAPHQGADPSKTDPNVAPPPPGDTVQSGSVTGGGSNVQSTNVQP